MHKSEKILNSILSRKIVARFNIKKGDRFNHKNLKPVLVYEGIGLRTNEFNKIFNKS